MGKQLFLRLFAWLGQGLHRRGKGWVGSSRYQWHRFHHHHLETFHVLQKVFDHSTRVLITSARLIAANDLNAMLLKPGVAPLVVCFPVKRPIHFQDSPPAIMTDEK